LSSKNEWLLSDSNYLKNYQDFFYRHSITIPTGTTGEAILHAPEGVGIFWRISPDLILIRIPGLCAPAKGSFFLPEYILKYDERGII
jgi:hypothetical protein